MDSVGLKPVEQDLENAIYLEGLDFPKIKQGSVCIENGLRKSEHHATISLIHLQSKMIHLQSKTRCSSMYLASQETGS